MNNFFKMLNDQSGAAAAEYALILAIVGAGVAAAAWGLGNSIKGAMGNAATCIDGSVPTTASATAPKC